MKRSFLGKIIVGSVLSLLFLPLFSSDALAYGSSGGGVVETIVSKAKVVKALINDGAKETDSLLVKLKIKAEEAKEMAISNTVDFTGRSWEPFLEDKEWTLISGDGEKIVYIKVRSSDGSVSSIYSTSINKVLKLTPVIQGDLDGNNKVDIIDFSMVLGNWGTSSPKGDINKDGKVDIIDFSILISNMIA